jgi:hypothetical protein
MIDNIKSFLDYWTYNNNPSYEYHNDWNIFYYIIENKKIVKCRVPIGRYKKWNRNEKLKELGI